MWSRFTENARRAVYFAQEEAQGRSSNQVDADDLFLGCVRTSSLITRRLLESKNVDISKLQVAIRNRKEPARKGKADMSLASNAKTAIDWAYDAAKRLKDPYIGVEHLVIGIAQVAPTQLAQAMEADERRLEHLLLAVRDLRDNTQLGASQI